MIQIIFDPRRHKTPRLVALMDSLSRNERKKILLCGYIVNYVASNNDRSFLNLIPQDIIKLLIMFIETEQLFTVSLDQYSMDAILFCHVNGKYRPDIQFSFTFYNFQSFRYIELRWRPTKGCKYSPAFICIKCKESNDEYQQIIPKHLGEHGMYYAKVFKGQYRYYLHSLPKYQTFDKITFSIFIDFIDRDDIKGTDIWSYINPKYEYKWKIDRDDLGIFLKKPRASYYGVWSPGRNIKYIHSPMFKNEYWYNKIPQWLRITDHRWRDGRIKIHLVTSSVWASYYGVWTNFIYAQFGYTLRLEFDDKVIEWDGVSVGDKSQMRQNKEYIKLYPSKYCQYFHTLERDIATLQSIKIVFHARH